MEEKIAIKVDKLYYAYDSNKYAIKKLSLDIKAGTYTAILGHNGSGKSTLAKLILGLLEPAKGSIFVDGMELNIDNVYEIRNKVGIVFQNPDNQFIGATVRDDIAFGLENHCVESEKMDAIITEFATKVGMEAYLDKEPSNLSGGQKQRVAIAGVLAMAPKILIFDEATSMLDPKGKREIKELIRKTKEVIPDITIVSITHDIEEACLADEIIVLNKGEVYLQGKPEDVFAHQEKLIEIDLDIPFTYKIRNYLKEKNIECTSNNVEEMVKEICQ